MGFFQSLFAVICSVVRWFTSKNKTECINYLRSSSTYPTSKNAYTTFRNDTSLKSVRRRPVVHDIQHLPLQTPQTFLKMEQLDVYPMPNHILKIERDENNSLTFKEWINYWISHKADFRFWEEVYIGAYKIMAFFEEAFETIRTETYNFRTLHLHHIDGKEFSFNVTAGPKELITAIDEKQLNRFTLKSTKTLTQVSGKIKRRELNTIFVEIFSPRDMRCDEIYDIYFEVNRTNYQLQHSALNFIKEHQLFSILINNPSYHRQSFDSVVHRDIFQFTTDRRELNIEQMQAIDAMVYGQYNPIPYLLYGPPGTGKTKTVVAAIEKIVRTTTKNILVCAQSNAACNEITERLVKFLTNTEMLRMFSMSYDLDQISSTIEPFCNLFDNELKYPSLDYLYKFRVLICTLSVSGCLVRARNSIDFDPKHFGYVFIDECASANETMTLIPIVGLCTSVGRVHANIVLIGDPKQLDAVTKSDWSNKLGFKTSWFEQLFSAAKYARHAETGKFNQTYITQLIRNYRSHRAILDIPNKLFYESSLIAVAVPDLIKLEVPGLLSKNFPIIFQSVHGYCKKPDDDTSSYNMCEVDSVMEFIRKLMRLEKYEITQSDIGVVSPYKLQCNIIRKKCKNEWYKDIRIGSAEEFQGQERKVMIISTVRSGKRTLGDFVKNPQRFNVMITRAKSLLIVVGNPHLLSQDENWSTFIRFCFKNSCLIQDKIYFRPRNNQ